MHQNAVDILWLRRMRLGLGLRDTSRRDCLHQLMICSRISKTVTDLGAGKSYRSSRRIVCKGLQKICVQKIRTGCQDVPVIRCNGDRDSTVQAKKYVHPYVLSMYMDSSQSCTRAHLVHVFILRMFQSPTILAEDQLTCQMH